MERAQLPAGVAQHFHPPPPRLLPQIIRRQNPARQQRIVRHRVQPRLALHGCPRYETRNATASSPKAPADVLDHATCEIAIGSKLGIDAVKKLPGGG